MKQYTPSKKLLSNYARVMIDFALGKTKGIKSGDIIYLQFDADALPLAHEVYRLILRRGGHPILKMNEESFSRILIDEANKSQLTFFPEKYFKSLVGTIDHRIYLIAPHDPFYLKGADPKKLMIASQSMGKLKKMLFDKEDKGKLTWTLCLYGTEGLAREAGLSLRQFWNQIASACFLRDKDPVAKWRKINNEIGSIRDKLSILPIDTLKITAKDTDLSIKLGEKRKWLSGSGNNIPSFEIFTSPDWRGTEGHIYFNYPLYRYGNIIKDIHLKFKKGRIVSVRAEKNEKLLKELIKQENADKIGEYSLTDTKFSKIGKFMANTLYDENFGGKWGNTHLAVGSSYHDAYTGNVTEMKDKNWAALGFNESPEHTDIMATGDRVVEAVMKDGSRRVIYSGGHFVV